MQPRPRASAACVQTQHSSSIVRRKCVITSAARQSSQSVSIVADNDSHHTENSCTMSTISTNSTSATRTTSDDSDDRAVSSTVVTTAQYVVSQEEDLQLRERNVARGSIKKLNSVSMHERSVEKTNGNEVAKHVDCSQIIVRSSTIDVGNEEDQQGAQNEHLNDGEQASYMSSVDVNTAGSETHAHSSILGTNIILAKDEVLRAEEEELPVFAEPPGLRCGVLPQFCKSFSLFSNNNGNNSLFREISPRLLQEYENMSPFRNCRFMNFLADRDSAESTTHRNTIVLDLDETLVHTSIYPMPDASAVVDIETSTRVEVPANVVASSFLPNAARGSELVTSSPFAARAVLTANSARPMLYIKYRPHLHKFLSYCLDHFEVVIFTAGLKNYVRNVVQCIEKDMPDIHIVESEPQTSSDSWSSHYAGSKLRNRGQRRTGSVAGGEGSAPKVNSCFVTRGTNGSGDDSCSGGRSSSCISVSKESAVTPRVITLLHRDHCTPTNAGYVKDLFLLGRNLRRVVFVDNNAICGVFQPFNCVQVKDFVRRPLPDESVSTSSYGISSVAGSKSIASTAANDRLTVERKDTEGSSSDATTTVSVRSDTVMVEVTDSIANVPTKRRVTLAWDDPHDNTLEELIQPDGILHNLRNCKNVPRYISRMMVYNRHL